VGFDVTAPIDPYVTGAVGPYRGLNVPGADPYLVPGVVP
jgi:hypothetical protein